MLINNIQDEKTFINFIGKNYFDLSERILLYFLLLDYSSIAIKNVIKILHITLSSYLARVSKLKQVITAYAKLRGLDRAILADELLLNYSKKQLRLLFFIESRKNRHNIARYFNISFYTVRQRFEKISQIAKNKKLVETLKYIEILKDLFYLYPSRKKIKKISYGNENYLKP